LGPYLRPLDFFFDDEPEFRPLEDFLDDELELRLDREDDPPRVLALRDREPPDDFFPLLRDEPREELRERDDELRPLLLLDEDLDEADLERDFLVAAIRFSLPQVQTHPANPWLCVVTELNPGKAMQHLIFVITSIAVKREVKDDHGSEVGGTGTFSAWMARHLSHVFVRSVL
jgi:hypothetical protein